MNTETNCKTDPRAPHGFVRNASHSEDRYVCECEFWTPPEALAEGHLEIIEDALQNAIDAFDECKDYPITYDRCLEAMSSVQALKKTLGVAHE